MKLLSCLYLAVFLACGCRPATAQNIAVKHFGVADGLPSSECYRVMQDSRHFLWIATDAGVVKYDGYRFVTYNSSKGLPDNTVFKIHEDRHGRIWFSTYSGKFAYYRHETDSIYTILANKQLSERVKLLTIDFCFDNKDTLWAALALGGYVKVAPPFYKDLVNYRLLNTEGSEKSDHEAPSSNAFLKEVDGGGFIYGSDLGKKGYVGSFYFIGPHEQPPAIRPADCLVPRGSNSAACRLGENNYLLSNGQFIYHISNRKVSELNDFHKKYQSSIISIFQDSKHQVWIGTHSYGFLVLNAADLHKPPRQFFPNLVGTCTLEDTDHGYWFTSTNNGLYYTPSLKFNYYNRECGLSSDKVYSIALIQDKLYCTVNDLALNILNLSTKTFTYRKDNEYGLVASFGNDLLCTYSGLSGIVNEATHRSFMIKGPKAYGRFAIKRAIEAGDDSLIGIDNNSTLHKISRHTGQAVVLATVPDRASSLYKSGDRIFIGTKQGLYRLDQGRLCFLGDSVPMLANRIEGLTGKGDMLFIATKGFGVLCYRYNKITAQFNEANGLASNLCKCITMDSDDNIWVGTNRGLTRLEHDANGQYRCNTLNLSNGLISNEINQVLEYRHMLYVATNEGLSTFDIKEAFDQPKSIPIYIEDFSVNNKKLDYRHCQDLRYNDNFIRISYKGVYLKNGGDINYKYRLEGLDTSWMYTRNIFVQFTTLPAGHYKFVAYAISSQGILSPQPAIIVFNVGKPFWKTWWFMLPAAALALLLLYAWYRKRIAGIRQKEEEKTAFNKQLAESELKALRSQMNPHFIFNAINSIQNFIIKNESAEAQKYLTKFSRLIRSVLESSTHETILLSSEIETLSLYLELESLRASFSFDYEIKTGSSLANKTVYIPPMLVQPYVENAILHGLLPLHNRRGLLSVSFGESQGSLICRIDDNGIGRQNAQELKLKKNLSHRSIGMSVTNERIGHLNKHSAMTTSVEVLDKYENGEAAGTTVIIEIKIQDL